MFDDDGSLFQEVPVNDVEVLIGGVQMCRIQEGHFTTRPVSDTLILDKELRGHWHHPFEPNRTRESWLFLISKRSWRSSSCGMAPYKARRHAVQKWQALGLQRRTVCLAC